MSRITYIAAIFIVILLACETRRPEGDSIEIINSPELQDSIFQKLSLITNSSLQIPNPFDSLAFLVLPVQASCPSCRKKIIDSIMKHISYLPNNHFIIISANLGRKTLNGYFREQNYELPIVPGKLLLDTTNQAYKHDLYSDKPTMYYCHNQKAYKKVTAIPMTVKDDLKEFFSGFR